MDSKIRPWVRGEYEVAELGDRRLNARLQTIAEALYVPSSRHYPQALQSPEYPDGWQVQRVRRDGSIRLGDKNIAVSMMLRGEPVGIEYQEDGGCKIHYGRCTWRA